MTFTQGKSENCNSHLSKDVSHLSKKKKFKRNSKNAHLSMKFSVREDQLHTRKAKQQTTRSAISYVNDRQKSN